MIASDPNVLIEHDSIWEIQKNAVERRIKVRAKNKNEFQKLNNRLNSINLAQQIKLDDFKKIELEIKNYEKKFKNKLETIKTHLTQEQIQEIVNSEKKKKPIKSPKVNDTIYTRLNQSVKKNKNNIGGYVYGFSTYEIENSLDKLSTDNKYEDEKSSTIKVKKEAHIASTISLPSIMSEYAEKRHKFLINKNESYDRFYYSKFCQNRHDYEQKANAFSRNRFSCHKLEVKEKEKENQNAE